MTLEYDELGSFDLCWPRRNSTLGCHCSVSGIIEHQRKRIIPQIPQYTVPTIKMRAQSCCCLPEAIGVTTERWRSTNDRFFMIGKQNGDGQRNYGAVLFPVISNVSVSGYFVCIIRN
jgi:hypothetical protein